MHISRQNLLLGISGVMILAALYIYFFTGSSPAPISATPAASPAEQQFLDLAAQLTPISFDTSIFNDPRFTALVDITTPITPESQGRKDPFSPLAH